MNFPVIIHKDAGSDFGVTVPDLPGCFSAGATLDEALLEVVEAIECHLEAMLMDGEVIPEPKSIDDYNELSRFDDGIWKVVTVDASKLNTLQKI